MYICEYCGRYLKKKYEKCPACGSTTFKKVQSIGEIVIKDAPKDGYKVNLKNYKYEKKFSHPGIYIGLFIIMFGLVFCISFASVGFDATSAGFIGGYLFIGFAIFTAVVLAISAFEFFHKSGKMAGKSNEQMDKIKYLSKHGMLIKNLKYTIEPVKETIRGDMTTYRIRVIYEIEKGKTKCFESEPKYLTALGRDDGTVDLLVDPKDYSNYFIDFEIY